MACGEGYSGLPSHHEKAHKRLHRRESDAGFVQVLHHTPIQSPSYLLFGRRLSLHLNLLYPDLDTKVCARQNLQKHTHNYHAQDHGFELDDLVFAKNYRQSSPWLPGVMLAKRSATLFLAQLTEGSGFRRNPDQLKHRSADVSEAVSDNSNDIFT